VAGGRVHLRRGCGLSGERFDKRGQTIGRGSFGRTMAKFNPFQFLQEVRAETAKVTWPSRRETLVTTGMVFVFVTLATIFFFVVDQVIRVGMTMILNFLR
jgi:preprotein translocase subunit SecE